MRVAAVVVTYNRCELLIEALQHIEEQSQTIDEIIVINNASTDQTTDRLMSFDYKSNSKMSVINLETNIGGAGGFNRGLIEAYRRGHDYIWLMDDDTMPKAECLEKLIEGQRRYQSINGVQPAFACSTVYFTDGSLCKMNLPHPDKNWLNGLANKQNYTEVNCCSFVSMLISREKLKEHGLPMSKFFIWYDDTEFSMRLTRSGHPGILCLGSEVVHKTPTNGGSSFSEISNATVWKYSYGIRNQAATNKRERGYGYFCYFVAKTTLSILRSDITMMNKLKLMKSLVSAIFFDMSIEMVE